LTSFKSSISSSMLYNACESFGASGSWCVERFFFDSAANLLKTFVSLSVF
jgi:hypothetical protein